VFLCCPEKKEKDTQSCWAAHSNYSTINPISIKDRAKFPFFFLFRLGLFLFLSFFFLLGFRPLFTKTKIVQRKKYIVSSLPLDRLPLPPPPNHLCTERARRYCGHVIERSALWPFLYRVIKVFFLFFLFFCCLFSYFCVDTPVLVYTCRLPFMYHRHHFCSDSLGLIFLIEKKISFNPIRNDSNPLRCY
jgi:hypothetical protein